MATVNGTASNGALTSQPWKTCECKVGWSNRFQEETGQMSGYRFRGHRNKVFARLSPAPGSAA
jgi:hypothetical protein